jgi:hypothetical protein
VVSPIYNTFMVYTNWMKTLCSKQKIEIGSCI